MDGRQVFHQSVDPEIISDGYVFDVGAFSHCLVKPEREGFPRLTAGAPPELLLADGRKPVPSPSSAPFPSAPGKKELLEVILGSAGK